MKPIQNLYIHVPFCLKLSPYSDFKEGLYSENRADHFLLLLEKEFVNRKKNWDLETIYIGGGTPSCLTMQQTTSLMLIVKKFTKEFAIKEYTIEATPEDVTLEKAQLWKKHGVNRVSLEVHSFNNKLLKTIKRKHDVTRVFKAFNTIKKAGITNISIDLIFNLPTQTADNIRYDLEQVKELNPSHISWYAFVGKKDGKGQNYQIDTEQEADYMELVQEGLAKQGYNQYEVSNFCKKTELRSQHNIAYWKSNNWIGIGWGATSFIDGQTIVNKGQINDFKQEVIPNTKEEVFEQVIMMALRYVGGLDLTIDLHKEAYIHFEKGIKQEVNKGNLVVKNNNISVKKKKWMLLDTLLVDIFTTKP